MLFVGRPMDRTLPLKFPLYSAVLLVLATHSYAYQLPGDPPASGVNSTIDLLPMEFSNIPMKSSMSQRGNDAATLKYKLEQTSGIAISSSYSNRLENPFDTPDDLEMEGFWDVELSTPRSGAMPAMKIEYSVGGFDGETGSDFVDSNHRKFNIQTKGKLGFFDHGVGYKVIGSDYEVVDKKNKVKDKDKDRESINSWIGKSFGKLYLTQFIEQKRSNVNSSTKREINDSLVGTSVSYTWSNWPYISTSFSHATGTRENPASSSSRGFELDITSLKSSLSASHNKWNADLSVRQTIPESAAGELYGQPESTNFYVGGSYYPNGTLTLSPSINRSLQSYQDYGAETETVSTSLSMVYRPRKKNYSFNIYASHDSSENLDWGMDTNYFYAQAGIQWELSGRKSTRNLLSLTVGYDRYEDELYSGANSDDYSVKISFKSYSLGGVLRSRNQFRESNSSFMNGLTASPFYEARPAFP